MTGEEARGSDRIVFISRFRVKEGKLGGYRAFQHERVRVLEAQKPGTLAFLSYADDESRLTIVHLFGDASAVDRHFEGSQERAKAAYQFLEPQGWEVYGAPNAGALEMLRGAASSAGVPLTVQPKHLDGFLRLSSG